MYGSDYNLSNNMEEKKNRKIQSKTRMWADAQRDGRPAEYRWHRLRKFCNSIPCTMPQSLANARCSSAVQ